VRSALARYGVGATVGLISAGIALGVGEIAAAFVRTEASPVIAVGNRVIALTPESVKRWAIRTFGADDKAALLTGIYLIVALAAIGIGMLAMRRLELGLAGIVAFGVIGGYCAVSGKTSRASDVTPTIIGTVAALAAMVWLARAAVAWLDDTVGGPYRGSDRRRFLLGSLGAAAFATLAGFGGRAAQHARFDVSAARAALVLPKPASPAPALPPGTDLGKSGIPWVTPNNRFYRVDTALAIPQIEPKDWQLRVHGMVEHELTLNYDQLLARPLIERWITLCCVSNEVGGNLISNTRWLGARLADVLREAGLQPGADQLLLSDPDGMTIGAPTAVVMDGRDSLLAVGMNGQPLPLAHGFPVRTVVPGLYGYVSACKWVVDIEATRFSQHSAYWVQGGWAAHPDIALESRIDTPHSGDTVSAGQPVPVAGVAWDQHVGVSKVEVQVNGGTWASARLASVPSTDTWRQWVWMWTPPKSGSYVLKVRATDSAGNVQTTRHAQPFPSGATGLAAITVRAS
jgi:DMSO/TMAO reductase YedYZ molybdopterin-dependent catalytic subunit